MKLLKLCLSSTLALFVILFSTTSHMTSCVKESIHDTIVIRDTVVITDTVSNINYGLVALYRFTNGSLQDESGKNNHIVFNNAVPAADKNGNPNNAYLFDGASSYMRVTNSASLNPNTITIVAKIKINGFYSGSCHANQVVGKGYPDNVLGYYNLRFRDNYNSCYDPVNPNNEFFVGSYGDDIPQGTASGATADTSLIKKDTWYTVIYSYDGAVSRIYINGQLKALETKAVTFTPNNQDLFIGRHEDPQFPYWFNGVIDELRIYKRALCSGEIDQLSVESL